MLVHYTLTQMPQPRTKEGVLIVQLVFEIVYNSVVVVLRKVFGMTKESNTKPASDRKLPSCSISCRISLHSQIWERDALRDGMVRLLTGRLVGSKLAPPSLCVTAERGRNVASLSRALLARVLHPLQEPLIPVFVADRGRAVMISDKQPYSVAPPRHAFLIGVKQRCCCCIPKEQLRLAGEEERAIGAPKPVRPAVGEGMGFLVSEIHTYLTSSVGYA